jgi:hypothetical protein
VIGVERRSQRVVWESISTVDGIFKRPRQYGKGEDFCVTTIYGLDNDEQELQVHRFRLKRDAVKYIAEVGEGRVPKWPTEINYETQPGQAERCVGYSVIIGYQKFGLR